MNTNFRMPIRGVASALAAFALAAAAPLAWAQGAAKNAVESVTFSAVQGGKKRQQSCVYDGR